MVELAQQIGEGLDVASRERRDRRQKQAVRRDGS
jgi:hypothetical protein